MTVAPAERAPATFEIKSANLPLVSLLLKSADLDQLSRDLAIRFGDVPDFFDHDPLVIDLAPLQAHAETTLDIGRLLTLLRQYRVLPIAVSGGSAAQMQAAAQHGLAAAPELQARRAVEAPGRREEAQPTIEPASVDALVIDALVIDKPLRSGQQVYARGRDLVVMAMVNAGAEVIADGHIHVYAPLRGKAIAGARGNIGARIFSLCLEPELLSIAGVYRTSEIPLPAAVLSRPTQVRLVGGSQGKLVMDAITT